MNYHFKQLLEREFISLNKIDIPFIGYEDLISDKEASGRKKDLEDLEYLKNKKQSH